MELNRVYFFTSTIHNWIPLLANTSQKEIILSSLKYLVDKSCLKIYGFVIMPNHIHLILESLELNGKEMPHVSFLKFTSHSFLKTLKIDSTDFLEKFKVKAENKTFEFWQRGALSVELYTPSVAFQKLNYIHNNPCQKKWMLSEDPVSYFYSSLDFYETGKDKFGFLTHIGERL